MSHRLKYIVLMKKLSQIISWMVLCMFSLYFSYVVSFRLSLENGGLWWFYLFCWSMNVLIAIYSVIILYKLLFCKMG